LAQEINNYRLTRNLQVSWQINALDEVGGLEGQKGAILCQKLGHLVLGQAQIQQEADVELQMLKVRHQEVGELGDKLSDSFRGHIQPHAADFDYALHSLLAVLVESFAEVE